MIDSNAGMEHIEGLPEWARPSTRTTPPPVHRLTIERTGAALVTRCWCGKSVRLETVNVNVFVRRLNAFLAEHAYCDPPTREGENA